LITKMSKLVVMGAGYVGLSSAACFSHLGHDVWCVDINAARINAILAGEMPIIEDGLPALVDAGIRNGSLRFTTDLAEAADSAEMVFLCVPTPQGADGSADLSFVQAAARSLAELLQPGAVVVNKSTVPVGSTKIVEQELQRPDVFVVSNPEFLREGTAIYDFLHPDRIVVGADDREIGERVCALYAGIEAPMLITDPASAETIKYAANAFLATKISYINAVAAICEGVGADIHDVVLGLGFDKRIGDAFLKPGPGWGGSCLPKDTSALIKIGEQVGYDFDLLRGVIVVNEQQYERVVQKIVNAAGGILKGKTIGVWGLTFKANTGDLRDSPALRIVGILNESGAIIRAFDPAVDVLRSNLDGIELFSTPLDAVEGAEVLVVLTEWEVFKEVSPNDVKSLMKSRNVVDARNVLEKDAWQQAGFGYQGIGR
jgi:UDPglucose 6-dehydrogenase